MSIDPTRVKVLVTGASGFIGSPLLTRLLADGLDATGAVRTLIRAAWEVESPPLGPHADWTPLLKDKQVVVHTAARAHVLNEDAHDPLHVFRELNTAGTARLAAQAAEMGVKRFVFLSSIGVNGNRNQRPFTEADEPDPKEPYAVSKLEAEEALHRIAEQTGLEVVILRPPLVYGPGAKGNFGRLIRAVKRGVPLPLGAVTKNRRTLLGLDNLLDLTLTCLTHPSASNQVFLAGDAEDVSTAELLSRLALALEVPPRLIRVPLWMLEASAAALGKRALLQPLCGSLQVDTSKARRLLGWKPAVSVDEGLRRAAQGLREYPAT